MKLTDKFRAWRVKRAAKRYLGSVAQAINQQLVGGRETQPRWAQQFALYDGVLRRNYLHERHVMETLSFIRDISPDASMAIWNFLRLANNGHELAATDQNDNPDEKALDYLNNLAAHVGRLYGGGTDQLINVMLLTGYTQGAIALEVELTENLKDVRDFHPLDPSRLDFQVDKDTQETKLVQKQVDGSYKELNSNQVFYQPFDPDVDDPYGRSPILPVLQIIFFQVEVLKDLKQVAHHQGHARFDISVMESAILENIPPQIASQGPDAVKSFVRSYVSDIQTSFKKLKPDDNFFHTDSVKVDMAGGTQGKSMDGTALINIINQQVTTALKQLPILLGHNDTVTETHGTVQYQIFVNGINSIRRGVKRMLERAYNLALQVQGSQSSCTLTFDPIRTTDRLADAQASQAETNNLIAQVNQGWISNDEAANSAVGHDAVGEPQVPSIANVLRNMPVEQRGTNSKKSKAGKGGDDFVKGLETGYANDLAKLTDSAIKSFHSTLSNQLATYQSRLKKSGTPPTRVLMAVVRSVEKRDTGIPPEFERWVKVHILNDSDTQMRAWNDELNNQMSQAAQTAGESTLAELTTDIDFNDKDTQLLRWLQERSLRDADLIQGASDEEVIKTLWDTVMEGKYTVDKAVDNLSQSYFFSKGRARTIARTEMISAGRAGQFQGDMQSGMVIGKTWRSAHDNKTRDAHKAADGQTVKFDQPFTVWGEQLMFPGDVSEHASARNIINCRCFYTRILEGEEDKLLGSSANESIQQLKASVMGKTRDIISEIQQSELNDILLARSETELNLYNKLADNFGNNEYHDKGKGWYLPGKKIIQMDINDNKQEKALGNGRTGAWNTKFHEEFHQLDHILGKTELAIQPNGKLSTSPLDYAFTKHNTVIGRKIIDSINEDVISVVNKSVDWYNKENGTNLGHVATSMVGSKRIAQAFFDYLDANYPDDKKKFEISIFTDAAGLISNDNLSPLKNGFWGHKTKYNKAKWKDGASSETWASFGGLVFTADDEMIAEVKKIMPKTWETLQSVYNEVQDYASDNDIKYP